MLEKQTILDELESKGIPVALGSGLQFESEEELSAWTNEYRTAQPTKDTVVANMTKDEFLEYFHSPDFKGAKEFQSAYDSFKAKQKAPTPKAPEKNEALEAIQAQLLELKNERENEKKDKQIKTWVSNAVTELNGDSEVSNRVNQLVNSNDTEETIKAKVKAEIDYLTKMGVQKMGVPGRSNFTPPKKGEKGKSWAEREKKRQERKL